MKRSAFWETSAATGWRFQNGKLWGTPPMFSKSAKVLENEYVAESAKFKSVQATENKWFRGARECEKRARKMKKAPLRRLSIILYETIIA